MGDPHRNIQTEQLDITNQGNGFDNNKSNNDKIVSSIQVVVEETKHIYQEDYLIYSFVSQKLNSCSIEESKKRILKSSPMVLEIVNFSMVKLNKKKKLNYFAILNKDKEYKLTNNDLEMIIGEFKEDKSKQLWRCFLSVTQLNKKMRLGVCK